jgi:hypothetical protein
VASQKPRLVAEISEDTDRRLRLLVVLRRQPLTRVLTDVLDRALPSCAELAQGLTSGGTPKTDATIAAVCANPAAVEPGSYWAGAAAAQERAEAAAPGVRGGASRDH